MEQSRAFLLQYDEFCMILCRKMIFIQYSTMDSNIKKLRLDLCFYSYIHTKPNHR